MGIQVSVVIPVYNAGPYLQRCIESLRKQTLRDCEFIFINDGSTDQSESILETYKAQDERIVVIHQTNQGVSLARNAGLNAARGEYIGFVDADDDIEGDMYETLYNTAVRENSDVVISNFECELDGRTVITRYPFLQNQLLTHEYIKTNILPYFVHSDDLNTAVNKLYRRRIIFDNQIAFPPGVPLGEDGMFNMQYFSHAASAFYIDYSGYHYREVTGSATRNILKRDYFSRALEVYRMQLPQLYTEMVSESRLQEYKSVKLIDSVMAYVHIYFAAHKELRLADRWKYVRSMVKHEAVQQALHQYWKHRYAELGKYHKLIVRLIRNRSVIGLFCATAYSRFRNQA